MTLEEQIQQLQLTIIELRNENVELRKRIVELESALQAAIDKLNKNSNNSSKPPSTDIQRTKSMRTSSNKKAGGQAGHQGTTLEMSSQPDKIITHRSAHCKCCGKDIRAIGSLKYERRQVYDIPPLQIRIEEHRSEIVCCPHCSTENRGSFPEEVKQPVQYGSSLKQLGVYLTQYQLLPYERSAELIEDLTGHRLSVGTLVNINEGCSAQLSSFIEDVKDALQQEPVMHSDETGFYFAGKRNWLHVATTKNYTYYYAHEKRGTDAMKDMSVLPDYAGTLMHDYWKSYLDYECKHVFCHAHHLRDLTFCHEQEKSQWAALMKALLLEMKAVVDSSKEQGKQRLEAAQEQMLIEKYEQLMQQGYLEHPLCQKEAGKRGAAKKSKTQNLLERFQRHKEEMVRFVKDFSIPFDNNIAEQAIRMMKVKQKISGCFRSKSGAQCFAIIRSYIDTIRKQGHSITDALKLAILGKPIAIARLP
ncbi:MAG TPA: IS66 family transposase [Chitinophagaceae bacterium]|nr:IS66 family transposase [Chitinophagaceae bacterium]